MASFISRIGLRFIAIPKRSMSSVNNASYSSLLAFTDLQQSDAHANGRQYSGMTRNSSPVYPFYPPDPSGRRPSRLTELQYVNPAQREAERIRPVSVQGPSSVYCQPEQHLVCNPPSEPHHHIMSSSTHSYYDHPSTRRTNSGAGLYTPSGSGNGNNPCRSHPQPTRTLYWYCCQRCACPGPYLSSLYASCLNCGVQRCSRCREVVLEVRDCGYRS